MKGRISEHFQNLPNIQKHHISAFFKKDFYESYPAQTGWLKMRTGLKLKSNDSRPCPKNEGLIQTLDFKEWLHLQWVAKPCFKETLICDSFMMDWKQEL